MNVGDYAMAMVEWVDSSGDSGQWTPMDEQNEMKSAVVYTLGFILRSNSEEIAVALSLDSTNDHYCSCICIPRVSVISVKSVALIESALDVKSESV